MPTKKMIVCPKCGASSSVRNLKKRNSYCCESCAEPLRELIEMVQALWAEDHDRREVK